MVPTFQHNSWTSGRIAAYTRPALAYHFLRDALGDEIFKKALHEYMNSWHGKHPGPYDFFNIFESVTGEDLSWFFQPWFFEFGYPDLSIEGIKQNNEVIIEKIGTHPVTVVVTYFTEDNFSDTITLPTSVWKTKQNKIKVDLPDDIVLTKVVLGNDNIPDVNKENNVWEKK